MKKLTILTIVLATILLLSSAVFAANVATTATISASNTEVKNGDEVTVTVSLNQDTLQGDFVMKFDSSVLKYTGNSFGALIADPVEGGVRFVFSRTEAIRDLKVTFEVVGEVGSSSNVTISDYTQFGDWETTLDLTVGEGKTITVVDTTPTPTPTPTPTEEVKPTDEVTPTEEVTPTKDVTPTKASNGREFDQTGVSVLAVFVVSLVAVIGSAIVIKRK